MSCYRFLRRLGVDGRAAVTLQWLWRTVAGVIAIESIQHIVAPTFGVTILSLSQLINRMRLPTTPIETFMETETAPVLASSPLAGVEMLVSLVVWGIILWSTICLLAALWSWFDYCLARPARAAAMNRGDQ
jgi:hypothetical protein